MCMTSFQVRKLDFLMADALQQGCTSVIVCGDVQSNCCCATAICARALGMQVHLLLTTDEVRSLKGQGSKIMSLTHAL